MTTQTVFSALATAGQPGYIGVRVETGKSGKLVVQEIEAESPAAKAGLKAGDALTRMDGRQVKTASQLRDGLQAATPGAQVRLTVERKGRRLELAATVGAVSRPLKLNEQRAFFGLTVGEPKEGGDGALVVRVQAASPAEKAGLRTNDVVVAIADCPLTTPASLFDALMEKQPGDTLALTARRNGRQFRCETQLTRARASTDATASSTAQVWKKDVYRLAVLPVEFPGLKFNPAIKQKDWAELLFSAGVCQNKTNVTGQFMFGSVNDYYREMSCGAFRFAGKVFNPVEAGKKREDYAPGNTASGKAVLLNEVIDKVLARDGKEALKEFDGLLFIYAGDRFPTLDRGSLYWPHRSSVTHRLKRWSYVICPEGGQRMTSVSLFGHEFGHLLGLPDLYARSETPWIEGAGIWCGMANQIGGGRPQHFTAWCKERLGWLRPAVIDPTVRQKLILGPVEGSATECYKVLVRRDGSEYFLLENRRRAGFDRGLPGEGLLIWRVVGGKPVLEESHGIEGPMGPRLFLSVVPYPSRANTAFTPWTTPSSRAQLGGGLPVHITNIRQLPDGRVTFEIGYEYE
jgi:M6 family metalloprotease-like protein